MKTQMAMMTAIVLMTLQVAMATEPTKKFVTQDQKIAFAKKNLLAALSSGNMGVIESSMRISAQLKIRYPEENVSALINGINTVWQNHPAGKTRYKAFIAKSICENPEWYCTNTTLTNADDDTFFIIASKQMQEQLLSLNAN